LKAIYDAAHTLQKPIATDKDYDRWIGRVHLLINNVGTVKPS